MTEPDKSKARAAGDEAAGVKAADAPVQKRTPPPVHRPENDGSPWEEEGPAIVALSIGGTALFVVTAVAAAISDGRIVRVPAFAVDLALFLAGTVAFLMAFAGAVRRSRESEIGIGGLYFLAGETAPKPIKIRLMGAFAVEVVTAFVTAGARPYTSLAFGILVPTYGLGLAGVWGARYGAFAKRAPAVRRTAPRRPPEGGADG